MIVELTVGPRAPYHREVLFFLKIFIDLFSFDLKGRKTETDRDLLFAG